MATFYLSSTYEDLKECREAVSTTLRQMGHDVIGMENYTADGRAPLARCLADVGECDAYLGIFAWRYGYVPKKNNPQRQAITELEYREALRLNKEPLIFILSKDSPWPGDRYPEDDKERQQIRALREELSEDRTFSSFRDCNDLATKVSVAVGLRFPKGEDPPVRTTLRSPSPPRSRPWKWYGLAAIACVVLIFLAYGTVTYWRQGPIVVTEPEYWVNDWSARFTKAEKLEKHWQYPKGHWSTEPGELADKNPDDLALLVKGQEMGIPNDLDGKVFRDFRATFKIRFKNGGTRAAWVLRAQPDRAGGYLFELVRDGTHLFLYGWIYDQKQKRESLGNREIPFGLMRESKSLFIDVLVEDNKFDYILKFNEDQPNDERNSGEPLSGAQVVESFQDDPAKVRWPWGTIGFLVTDDNSVMRVESVYVYQRPKKL